VEELGLGRVQILCRHVRRHCPPTEGDDPPARVRDRKHDAIAEAVIGNRHVLEDREPTGFHLGLLHPPGGQVFLQRVAAVGRIAKPECLLGCRREPTVAQIGTSAGAFAALQPLLEEGRRHLHHVRQAGALLFPRFGLFVPRRHGHAGQVGDALDGFGEAQAIELGKEPKMVSRDTAAEAVVAPLAVLTVEARALLAVKGATGPPVALRGVGLAAVPRDARADHRGDRHPVTDFVEEGGLKAHRQARFAFI
jgi:hypothetical protein